MELDRPSEEVVESDLRLAESYHHAIMEIKRAREEELRLAREKSEKARREMEERWVAGRRREREEYQRWCDSSLRQLVARDTTRDSNKVR